ncbi:MAG: GlsB/YeaQ/YmgE family stress response membrane protein [Anaerolineales bacterium]|nr:GlsB/YeaQ/YmgE family stress response membrane protein [Anaerolineales bacterium]
MSITSFLLLLLVAAVCGMLGQMLAGYSFGGCLVSAGVGFIGALVGMWLAGQLGLPEPLRVTIDGESFPVVWSVIGSTLFVALLSLFTRRTI